MTNQERLSSLVYGYPERNVTPIVQLIAEEIRTLNAEVARLKSEIRQLKEDKNGTDTERN